MVDGRWWRRFEEIELGALGRAEASFERGVGWAASRKGGRRVARDTRFA